MKFLMNQCLICLFRVVNATGLPYAMVKASEDLQVSN